MRAGSSGVRSGSRRAELARDVGESSAAALMLVALACGGGESRGNAASAHDAPAVVASAVDAPAIDAPVGQAAAAAAGAAHVEPVLQLALGAYHTCALLESGRVACWGDNQRGQLGQSALGTSSTPLWVLGLDDAVEIRASDASTCARRRSGGVVCWGDNAHGEAAPRAHRGTEGSAAPRATDAIGEPPAYAPGNVQRAPAEIVELSGARGLAMGSRHGCALDGQGQVTCWGDGSFGQLGPGVSDAFQLRAVAGLPPLVELSAAAEQSCGRTRSGDVWCWGGARSPRAAPERVAGVTGATRVQVVPERACAWLASGDVTCWGDSGGCADTAAPAPAAPVAAWRDSLALARAAGGCFWCVLQHSHELTCDVPPEPGHAAAPAGRLSIAAARSVAAGNAHACALRNDGSVWCWGSNVRGELGRPTLKPRDPDPSPVQWAR